MYVWMLCVLQLLSLHVLSRSAASFHLMPLYDYYYYVNVDKLAPLILPLSLLTTSPESWETKYT